MLNSICMRMCTLVTAGAVTLALVAPLGGAEARPAAAGAAVTAPESDDQSARTVLRSEFGQLRSRVVGTYGRRGAVRGWFTPRRFAQRGDRLVAIGRLHAVLVRPNGTVRDRVTERIVIPVRRIEGVRPLARARLAQLPASCQILRLVLGPLDLDLLGLEVHLNRVVLRIVATPGPGNLLGNLLCAIAGLLDNPGVLTEIRRILNAILAILRL